MSVQSVLFVHLAFLYGPSPHAPGEFMRGWEPLHPPAGAPREHGKAMLGTQGDFLPDEKVTKESPRGVSPLGTPLGGIIIPPAARRAAPPRRTLHGELGAN